MESYSRVRSIKLKRVSPEHPFGFSVRGGHEHGTGIFVSFVDPRSIAYRQGLKVGDQILRVNGFPVSAAVHHECLSLMKIRTSLHLKARSVGMLPVKEKTGDPLTWKLVEEQPEERQREQTVHSRLSDTSSQPDSHSQQPTKVFIDISGQSGLGCCICKGPPERPGIFVQSTKSNGVAREAGLRPGDQVISCNGHSFLHIPFAEAVFYLKSSKQLNLRVVKGAASDLFPGESSGYNSSASSLNGDTGNAPSPSDTSSSPSTSTNADVIVHHQHHHHHDHDQANKRLSMVTEELCSSSCTNEELYQNQHQHQQRDLRDQRNSKRSLALDRSMEWDEVEQVWRKAEKETIVIEVKGQDPKDRVRTEEERLQEERRKLEETQRRLKEEAMRLEEDKRMFEEEKRRSLRPSASDASNYSGITETTNSLAGALNLEILKRHERRESNPQSKEDERPKPGTVEQKRSLFNNQIDQEKRQQHEQLIEEFKRAHRKMFAHTLAEEASKEAEGLKDGGATDLSVSASAVVKTRRVQKAIDHERQMVAQRVAGIVRQRQLRIERQHQEVAETEREIRTKSPPPPPPFPSDNTFPHATTNGTSSTPTSINKEGPTPTLTAKYPKALAPQPMAALVVAPKTVIIEEKTPSSTPTANQSQTHSRDSRPAPQNQPTQIQRNPNKGHAPPPPPPQRSDIPPTKKNEKQTDSNSMRRPESPSPDYSNSPSPIPSPPRVHRPKPIGVDMQSLESFRLKDPPRSSKKPPPVYFSDSSQQLIHPNQNSHVRLSAYPSVYTRPDPSRLEFLNGGSAISNSNKNDLILQRELEEALARCTLIQSSPGGMLIADGNSNMNLNRMANSRPNGGILKMGNGNSNPNVNKTISFVGKY